jgi:hypothetical protein
MRESKRSRKTTTAIVVPAIIPTRLGELDGLELDFVCKEVGRGETVYWFRLDQGADE